MAKTKLWVVEAMQEMTTTAVGVFSSRIGANAFARSIDGKDIILNGEELCVDGTRVVPFELDNGTVKLAPPWPAAPVPPVVKQVQVNLKKLSDLL